MTAPVLYSSTDGSAPTLSGTTGSLVAMLDACLTTGYGTQPSAGWAVSFTATSKRVYRPGGGNRLYLNIDDSGPGLATFQEARASGIEVASGIGAGTGIFPTTTLLNIGIGAVVIRKSAAASATTRSWKLIADDRTFYLFIQSGDTANMYTGFGFGDLYSVTVGDNYRTMIIGRNAENSATITGSATEALATVDITSIATANVGHFLARSYSGLGGAITMNKFGDVVRSGATGGLNGVIPLPNGPDQSVYISPLNIGEPGISGNRGHLRGLYQLLHGNATVSDGDTFSGTGAFAGRTFAIIGKSGGSSTGNYVVETSNTWDTSA